MVNKATLLGARNARARCDWVVREKEMLGQADHPFIIQLVCTCAACPPTPDAGCCPRLHVLPVSPASSARYADPLHVYFLMQPALGGEVLRDRIDTTPPRGDDPNPLPPPPPTHNHL